MAWTQRHDPLPSDCNARRRQTATRAGWRCEAPLDMGARCPEAGMDCDHIINTRSAEGQAMGDAVHGRWNLQWLCKEHHREKTQAEAKAAREYRRSFGRHPGERNHYSYR
ncbi:HNH endonuclease signature motif containing protein [Microbacterium sp. LBN7]|uniref:HNH endonuclease signature motif containing protein n=1 Tax=Microbacterium sp. LBN7 TaxID=3129773 RepID=UPI0032537FCB